MNLSWTAKRMVTVICAAALVIIAAGALFYRSSIIISFAFGVFLTSGINVLKVVLLERTVKKTLELEGDDAAKTAANYVRIHSAIRLLLTAAILVLAAVNPEFINLWGAIAGVFTWQIAAYSIKFFKNNPDL